MWMYTSIPISRYLYLYIYIYIYIYIGDRDIGGFGEIQGRRVRGIGSQLGRYRDM